MEEFEMETFSQYACGNVQWNLTLRHLVVRPPNNDTFNSIVRDHWTHAH